MGEGGVGEGEEMGEGEWMRGIEGNEYGKR